MSEQQKPQPQPVSVTIKCQIVPRNHDGEQLGEPFGFDLTAECLVNHIPGIVYKLTQAGITPAQTPYTWDAQRAAQNPPQMAPVANGGPQQAAPPMTGGPTPFCPDHNRPMKPSKFGGWYCTFKETDQWGQEQYCQQKVKA